MQTRTINPMEIAGAGVLLVVAAFAYWLHITQPYSEPQDTVLLFMQSTNKADLVGFQKASSPTYYSSFVRHFGEQKYERVTWIYRQVYQLGLPKWHEYRQRAQTAADVEYQRLHERVSNLGKEAFSRLSPEKRLELMDDQQKYQAFVFQSGVNALSASDRARIESVDAFREGRDRERFAEREAWTLLSAEDKAVLGSLATLSSTDTAEKLAFLDRMGLPNLSQNLKKEITNIPRSELYDPDAFKFKYGEPIAKEFFEFSKIPDDVGTVPCSFSRQDGRDSLLRGDLAQCKFQSRAKGNLLSITINLKKVDWRWLVEAVDPDFFKIDWQANHE